MHLKYTLCFVIDHAARSVLMLRRANPPRAGLWNGVGGKIEPGEQPLASVLREVAEETGLRLPSLRFGGVVTWSGAPDAGGSGGMYVYLAALPPGVDRAAVGPRETPEGLLDWLPLAAAVRPGLAPVVENIPHFLPPMLRDARPPCHHHCFYEQDRLLRVEQRPLPPEVLAAATVR